ncbi:HupE/UreJ family protein [Luteolibacter sp. AS25]|uniref:HupE/UreJ family protein n=1 Tax=Luteolibacter sp. AS25 TaxID=3135776 RepID=UPI00398A703F
MSRLFLGFILLASATAAVVPEYFMIGFTHIIPHGLDHILFLLALFFLTRNFSELLIQLTLFTFAHALTLGLSLYGFISAPTTIVEIAIALSICFVAVENLFKDHLSRWRPWVVFGSGLIHGLGFAHILRENPATPDNFLVALFSFNIGIEVGQIAVCSIAYLLVAAGWKRDCYQRLIARPASILIALSGFCWALVRIA